MKGDGDDYFWVLYNRRGGDFAHVRCAGMGIVIFSV